MYVDSLLMFSDAQAVTATAASTNYIDLGAVRDIGTGKQLYLVISCVVAMADSGSNTELDVSLDGDSTTTFSPDATLTVCQFAAASAAGTTKIIALSPGMAPLQYRYIQLTYTTSSGDGNLSAGSFDAFLTTDVDRYRSYADNVTIT